MRDIGNRIRRYRLSRYGTNPPPLLRRLGWTIPLLGLWLVYAVFLSDHSFLRLWLLDREQARVEAELKRVRAELAQSERQAKDPAIRRLRAEQALRERSGFVGPGEIIYRIPEAPSDSLEPGRSP